MHKFEMKLISIFTIQPADCPAEVSWVPVKTVERKQLFAQESYYSWDYPGHLGEADGIKIN